MFARSWTERLQHFRRIADVAFTEADWMTTNDFTTLQAFVTYLVSGAACAVIKKIDWLFQAAAWLTDTGRKMWTLTSTAVRIAHAIGLHTRAMPRSPFETELRRRLWHQICILDIFSGIERSAKLLIGFGSFDTPFPRQVNDVEFNEHMFLELICHTALWIPSRESCVGMSADIRTVEWVFGPFGLR